MNRKITDQVQTAHSAIAASQSAVERLRKIDEAINPLAAAMRKTDGIAQVLEQVELARSALVSLEKTGLRQADIAAHIGVSQATISRAMNTANALKPGLAERIIEFSDALKQRMPDASLALGEASLRRTQHSGSVLIEINPRMAAIAEDVGADLSELFATVGMEAVRAELKKRWNEANREAIEDQNAYFAEHGLPLAKYRTW